MPAIDVALEMLHLQLDALMFKMQQLNNYDMHFAISLPLFYIVYNSPKQLGIWVRIKWLDLIMWKWNIIEMTCFFTWYYSYIGLLAIMCIDYSLTNDASLWNAST